jgi:hypothetical protein
MVRTIRPWAAQRLDREAGGRDDAAKRHDTIVFLRFTRYTIKGDPL